MFVYVCKIMNNSSVKFKMTSSRIENAAWKLDQMGTQPVRYPSPGKNVAPRHTLILISLLVRDWLFKIFCLTRSAPAQFYLQFPPFQVHSDEYPKGPCNAILCAIWLLRINILRTPWRKQSCTNIAFMTELRAKERYKNVLRRLVVNDHSIGCIFLFKRLHLNSKGKSVYLDSLLIATVVWKSFKRRTKWHEKQIWYKTTASSPPL